MKLRRTCDYFVFCLLISIWSFPAIALSQSVGYTTAKCIPKEVHITYGDTTSEVVIIWSTEDQCIPTKVQYALNSPWGLDQTAPGEGRVFEGPDKKKNYFHKVKLRDLQPSSTYYYKPSSQRVTEGPYMFKTAPKSASDSDVHFLVVSDLSSTSPAIPTLNEEASSGKYAAILHAGNIAMNLSTRSGAIGDDFFHLMEPSLRSVPYMVAPGPDEQEDGSYFHYLHRFSYGEWPISKDKMWYSVDIGPVHLISFSTEIFFTDNGQYKASQHDWLIRDLKLANTNREAVPWVVAFGHRPMYCSYEDPSLECNHKASEVKKGLEDILYRFGADIVIQSYGAAYERSYPQFKGVPVNKNYTDPLAPVHILTGGATPWDIEYNFTNPMPKWCAFRYTNRSVMSYGRLHIVNASFAEYEQVDAESNEVFDSFVIIQGKHGQFSIEDLPENVSATIDKNIKDAGGKPGVLNIEEIGNTQENSRIQKLLQGDNRNRLIIGVVAGVVIVVAFIVIITVRRFRKRRRTTRRWEHMDINYGKKFYSKAPDKDEDNDFEIDMSDGTEGTTKLLNSGD
ncbi:purple acid phosphatase [Plakobranchus ocellatus]|uniref:Purple acid phosphatase n=1 Tax=Plakobranchus ocellatus TaxID=259542 RepID=A0AAV4DAC3_9GAST|nr:purple acid phosphatase [Plakobranchus ocellatus]